MALDEGANNVHERGERMRFVFAYAISQSIKECDELLILGLSVGNVEQGRERWPYPCHALNVTCRHCFIPSTRVC